MRMRLHILRRMKTTGTINSFSSMDITEVERWPGVELSCSEREKEEWVKGGRGGEGERGEEN